jgi:hypothetical protein
VHMSPASYSGFIAKMDDMGTLMFPSAPCKDTVIWKVKLK